MPASNNGSLGVPRSTGFDRQDYCKNKQGEKMPNINAGSAGIPRNSGIYKKEITYLKIKAAGANTGSVGIPRSQPGDLEKTVQDAQIPDRSIDQKPEQGYSSSEQRYT